MTRRESNIVSIGREIDMTYSHLTKTIRILEKRGLISSKKVGRERKVSLTIRGRDLGEHILEISKEFRE